MPIDPRDVSTRYPFGEVENAIKARIEFSLHRYLDGSAYVHVSIKEPGAVLERMAAIALNPEQWAQLVAIVDEASNELSVPPVRAQVQRNFLGYKRNLP
mgnify:CR=1 FL=1